MAPLQHEKRCAPAAKFVSNGIEELSLFILFQDEHSHELSPVRRCSHRILVRNTRCGMHKETHFERFMAPCLNERGCIAEMSTEISFGSGGSEEKSEPRGVHRPQGGPEGSPCAWFFSRG